MGRVVPYLFWTDLWSLAGEAGRKLGLGLEHGGVWETSLTAASVPELVDINNRKKLKSHIPPAKTKEDYNIYITGLKQLLRVIRGSLIRLLWKKGRESWIKQHKSWPGLLLI